jgi:hypothetical protein
MLKIWEKKRLDLKKNDLLSYYVNWLERVTYNVSKELKYMIMITTDDDDDDDVIVCCFFVWAVQGGLCTQT